jgi:Tfp pilus assembly protein PilF
MKRLDKMETTNRGSSERNTMRFFSSMLLMILCVSTSIFAQEDKQKQKDLREAQSLMSDAAMEESFVQAEGNYRTAIALAPESETAKYNLANSYYDTEKNSEAQQRFIQAANTAKTKPVKHKAYHNLGNTFMNEKQYDPAIEAYKNALRNNPTDDETRYNLALAKKMKEEEDKNGGDGDDDKEQNKDQNKDDKKEQDSEDGEDKEDEGDKGDEKEDKDKGEEEDENKEGDKENDKGQPDEQKEGGDEKKQPQPQQPVPGQLSPQQVKNLLEAMNNEEKKVQEKINAQKAKGAKVKSAKDW